MKTIGLIGGMSWESTATYYRLMNEGVKQRLGGLASAKLVLASVNFAEVVSLQQAGDWDTLTAKLVEVAKDVERARCDAIIICTNTIHKLYEPIQAAVSVPILHICDVIGRHAASLGMKRLALTGTKFTMEEMFYRRWLEEKYDLQVVIPKQDERQEIHRIIFENLCKGIVKPEECAWFSQLNKDFLAAGCDAAILGCTELGMLVAANDPNDRLLCTTTLHAKAAVEFALA